MVEPVRHRQTKEAGTDMFEPKATAPHLDSTATTFVIIYSQSRSNLRDCEALPWNHGGGIRKPSQSCRRRPANKTEDHNQRRQKLWHKEISPDCAIAPQVALL